MQSYPQYLRAIAALFVLLHHAAGRIENVYAVDLLFGRGNQLAFTGVNLFFALSGFLMASQLQKQSFSAFAWHRIARIYPAFFMAVGVVIVLNLLLAGRFPAINPLALTLLPLQVYGPLQVEWTLNYEVSFYIATSLFCFAALRRYHLPFLLVWATAVLLAMYAFRHYGTSQFPAAWELPFSAWCLSFIFGGIAYHLQRFERFRLITSWGGVPLTLLLAASIAMGKPLPLPAFAAVLSIIVAYSFTARQSVSLPFLHRMGDASYALYLIHQTVFAWATNLLAHHVNSPVSMLAILIILGVHAGMILGKYDLMVYRVLKNISMPRFRVAKAEHRPG